MKLNRHRFSGMVLTDHEFQLPLNYAQPQAETLKVFAREVVAAEKASRADLPWLVFFQGGPGMPSPRPQSRSGWLKRALEEYRVLLLDQRGTGLSTPLHFQTLARFADPQAQADYLKNFRADSIVQDAEAIRRQLLGADQTWTGLGQSFGGFCLTHYLSAAPQGLRQAVITGGLPPVGVGPDEVYRATYRRVLAKNERHFGRYPNDRELAGQIVDHLSRHSVTLPGGGRLTPHRFQQLGLALGASDGCESIHYLLEGAFVEGPGGRELGYPFLRACENAQAFESNPLYAIFQEAIYCEGQASRWSAQRVRSEFPELEPGPERPFLFTGEMIYPWMFEDYLHLQPLQQAAEILAQFEEWPRLYDPAALNQCQVPVAAAVYYEDMYVETAFSEATARLIPGIRLWVTNEFEHNALRSDGEEVLDKLLRMLPA